MRTTITTLLAVLLSCGCASSGGGGLRIAGPTASIGQFAGDWDGTYEGEDTARLGTLSLSIDEARGTGRGEVMVTTDVGKHPVPLEALSVEGDTLTGQLAIYEDPACACKVQTKFVGHRDGVSLVGTWTTQPVGSDKTFTGRWVAMPKKP